MDSELLKRLHDTEIEILDEVVRICEKNNIKYCLIGGSLLGAIRHKGFIPWDDDIDIVMLRKDFNKFIHVALKELDNKRFFVDYYKIDVKHAFIPFAKVRMKDTLFEEDVKENYEGSKEIWIDIFPLDYIKSNNLFVKIKSKLVKASVKFLAYKENIQIKINFILKLVAKVIPKRILLKIFESIENEQETDLLVSFCGLYKLNKEIYKKAWFSDLEDVFFENRKYKIPKMYNEILSQVYGNYMELPPIEKRITHNPKKIKFENDKIIKFEGENNE